MLSPRTSLLLSVATGIALELGIHALSGRREAWDSPAFWTIGLPGALVLSAAIGWLSRGHAWLWTFAIAPSQVMTMMVRSGEMSGLWPLTLVLSALLSAPFVLAAFVGSRFRRRNG